VSDLTPFHLFGADLRSRFKVRNRSLSGVSELPEVQFLPNTTALFMQIFTHQIVYVGVPVLVTIK
jgi:hypothetical protein